MARQAQSHTADRGRTASRRARRTRRTAALACAVALLTAADPAHAQHTPPVWPEMFAGSAFEEYVRLLQAAGLAGSQPWGLRPFGPQQLDRLLPADAGHPWADRFVFDTPAAGAAQFAAIRPTTDLRFNSAFPAGSNDGPTWAGRGLTGTVSAGLAFRGGPLSLTLVPTVFRSQNATFTLQNNGQSGSLVYADGRFPTGVDRPQAFGDAAYGRIDPGESTVRLDAPGAAIGFSTASQWWGPAAFYPIILGNNAGGFPHAFFGTARPLSLPGVRLHGRLHWGALAQSEYSPVTGSAEFVSFDEPGTRRFTAGLVLIAQPTALSGLELGIARFFHEGWPADGFKGRHLTLPFEDVFKRSISDTLVATGQNQLLSVFMRWVIPAAGVEVYAERGRDDHSWDRRDLIVETEHSASTTFGFAKVWPRGQTLTALRAEVINYQAPANAALRHEGGFYPHSVLRQGHTHRGQLLGADIGVGSAAGGTVKLEHYTRAGKYGVRLSRDQVDRANPAADTIPESEVRTTLALDATRFVGRTELRAEAGLTDARRWNFASHASNFFLNVGTRIALGRDRSLDARRRSPIRELEAAAGAQAILRSSTPAGLRIESSHD